MLEILCASCGNVSAGCFCWNKHKGILVVLLPSPPVLLFCVQLAIIVVSPYGMAKVPPFELARPLKV